MTTIDDQPLAGLSSRQIARAGNVDPHTARWLRSMWGRKTIRELRVQACDDCGRTLVIHDTLSWHKQIHRTRCDDYDKAAGHARGQRTSNYPSRPASPRSVSALYAAQPCSSSTCSPMSAPNAGRNITAWDST